MSTGVLALLVVTVLQIHKVPISPEHMAVFVGLTVLGFIYDFGKLYIMADRS